MEGKRKFFDRKVPINSTLLSHFNLEGLLILTSNRTIVETIVREPAVQYGGL